MTNDELIAALRDADAVKYGEFELSPRGHGMATTSTSTSSRRTRTALELIAEAFAERLATLGDQKLAGVALGAVPLVAVTSVETGRPYVIARKQQKEYGTANLVEGNLEGARKSSSSKTSDDGPERRRRRRGAAGGRRRSLSRYRRRRPRGGGQGEPSPTAASN